MYVAGWSWFSSLCGCAQLLPLITIASVRSRPLASFYVACEARLVIRVALFHLKWFRQNFLTFYFNYMMNVAVAGSTCFVDHANHDLLRGSWTIPYTVTAPCLIFTDFLEDCETEIINVFKFIRLFFNIYKKFLFFLQTNLYLAHFEYKMSFMWSKLILYVYLCVYGRNVWTSSLELTSCKFGKSWNVL